MTWGIVSFIMLTDASTEASVPWNIVWDIPTSTSWDANGLRWWNGFTSRLRRQKDETSVIPPMFGACRLAYLTGRPNTWNTKAFRSWYSFKFSLCVKMWKRLSKSLKSMIRPHGALCHHRSWRGILGLDGLSMAIGPLKVCICHLWQHQEPIDTAVMIWGIWDDDAWLTYEKIGPLQTNS